MERLLSLFSLILLVSGGGLAQRHYGYQNPYQYHPYMRYHNYNHPAAAAAAVEEPQEASQQARHFEEPERPHPARPAHYGAYNPHQYQRPAAYGRYQAAHHPSNALRGHEDRKPAMKEMAKRPHQQQQRHHAAQMEKEQEEKGEPMYLGTFKNPTHEVKGDIFMLDDHTLYIQGFSFDGQAPDVYFWSDGVPIPYYTRSDNHLTMNVHEYKNEDIVLMLPPEKPTLEKMRKFQVWCKQYGINFGEFSIDS